MSTAISDLQKERDLMRVSDGQISEALALKSPGRAASEIANAYLRLQSNAERQAFVAVLGSRLAVLKFTTQSSVLPT